jgi:gamma-glutamylcyclotransferase (GGCT)/AIG2-like uncharacterized protein YtfP
LPPPFLFVYGTLKRGSAHPMSRRLATQSDFIGAGTISGRLYSLGFYPGLGLSEAERDRVHGDVVRLRNPAWSFSWIDPYEGCGANEPEPHYFRRVVVPVKLHSGAVVEAWVYTYVRRISPARHVPGGCWTARHRSR